MSPTSLPCWANGPSAVYKYAAPVQCQHISTTCMIMMVCCPLPWQTDYNGMRRPMEWWDDRDMQQWDDTMTLKDTVHNDVMMAADAVRMTTGCNEVAKGHSNGYGVPRCPAVHDNGAAAQQHNNSNSKRVQQ